MSGNMVIKLDIRGFVHEYFKLEENYKYYSTDNFYTLLKIIKIIKL
jgi:hypothetical protein